MSFLSEFSHFKLPRAFTPPEIHEVATATNSFLDSPLVSSCDPVSADSLLIYIPTLPIEIFPSFFLDRLYSLIPQVSSNSSDFFLRSCELHIRHPRCEPIPPHQDNFYHSFDNNNSFKFLIPLTNLHAISGGLIYSNINHDFPVLNHIASYKPAFSSMIDPISMANLPVTFSSHSLLPGDISCHTINSIHFAPSNYTSEITMFLVCRFDHYLVRVSPEKLRQYQKVFNQSTKSF